MSWVASSSSHLSKWPIDRTLDSLAGVQIRYETITIPRTVKAIYKGVTATKLISKYKIKNKMPP